LKHCILIVEDNLLNRELLRDWLEVEGYEVWSAADLKASYEFFETASRCVLLDINLGSENGLDSSPGCAKNRNVARSRDCRDGHALVTEREVICRRLQSVPLEPIDFNCFKKN